MRMVLPGLFDSVLIEFNYVSAWNGEGGRGSSFQEPVQTIQQEHKVQQNSRSSTQTSEAIKVTFLASFMILMDTPAVRVVCLTIINCLLWNDPLITFLTSLYVLGRGTMIEKTNLAICWYQSNTAAAWAICPEMVLKESSLQRYLFISFDADHTSLITQWRLLLATLSLVSIIPRQ